MPPASEDIADEPPSFINPYEILGVEKNATADEIKSAYRKQALRNHPDKVSAKDKEGAHESFQRIAFAYAILSDERRRRRYDTTGRTEESLDLEDDDFNWIDFYREQWRDVITEEAIEKFKSEYKGSDEEKRDLLESYENHEGDMNHVFETVMLSNPLEDEKRFREIIDAAIASGEVAAHDSYTKETRASRRRRRNEAAKEEQEARQMARDMGLEDKLFGDEDVDDKADSKSNKKKSKKSNKGKGGGDEASLASLIMARQKDRSTNFLDRLEAKYTAIDNHKKKKRREKEKGKEKKANKKRAAAAAAEMDDDDDDGDDNDGGGDGTGPPEEAFQKMAERAKEAKKKRKAVDEEEEEDNGKAGRRKRGKNKA
ncbi:hypothetical protein GP486_007989 [Trichoglossum hirsutum]|uniref:J domain-containing protein n=1 Tax=Trichoglossum hirsutum TaxID=265104 RepID=A0A9P8I5D2_9PEZI|nr:hypothetical protein GP486_007989 [Trichoglossum hirsutum]